MHFSSVEPSAAREIFLSEPLNMVICPINQCKEPDFQVSTEYSFEIWLCLTSCTVLISENALAFKAIKTVNA